MGLRKRCFLLVFGLVVSGALQRGPAANAQKGAAGAPAPTYNMMAARTVLVPDFHGKTLQQVQSATAGLVPGSRRTMFAGVDSQGPTDGVVASQNPVANTPVVPGSTRLLLTLEAPKPSKFATFIQQLASGLAAPPTAEQQKMAIVPDLRGASRTLASRYLETARLRARFTGSNVGVVAQQYPAAGSSVRPGTVVVVTMALPPVIVPTLFGLTLPEAIRKLQDASLLDGGVSGVSGEGSTVSDQSIAAGAQVPPGTVVDVTMRAPPQPDVPPPPPEIPPKIVVPSVLTMTGLKAEAALTSAGLRIGPWTGAGTWLVKTEVPVAGTEVEAGSEVDVNLSAPTVVVPDVARDTEVSARILLKTFGLQTRPSYALNGDTKAPHFVVQQSPAAGSVVDEGSTVDVLIGYDPPQPTRVRRAWDGIAAAIPLAPWWVWLAVVLLVVLPVLGIAGKLAHGHRIVLPPAACTLAATRPAANIRTGGQGPALRFKIALQDHAGIAEIHTAEEPALTRKG